MAEQKQMVIDDIQNEVSAETKIEEVKTEVKEVENTQLSVTKESSTTELGNPFLDTKSFNDMFKMASYLAKSDMVPQAYQGKPMNCLIAMEQAQRMNASPLMVMQNLYIVKGKPSWSGQACSMIVNGCGLFENVKLNYVGKKGSDDWGAYVSATRKSDGEHIEGTTVDMAMVKAEGWISNTKWKSMPQQMLGYRAYSFFARLYCPNALSGFQTEGEQEDSEARPTSKASNLNDI